MIPRLLFLYHFKGTVVMAAPLKSLRKRKRAKVEDSAFLNHPFVNFILCQHKIRSRFSVKRKISVAVCQCMNQRQGRIHARLTLRTKKRLPVPRQPFSSYISCIFFFLLLQIFSCVLRSASRSVLSYESPAECLPLRSFS